LRRCRAVGWKGSRENQQRAEGDEGEAHETLAGHADEQRNREQVPDEVVCRVHLCPVGNVIEQQGDVEVAVVECEEPKGVEQHGH
jgi:hypothetical protein